MQKTIRAGTCLLFYIHNCLKYDFSKTEGKNDNTFSICQYGLIACEEIIEIRTLCIQNLSLLYFDQQFKQRVVEECLKFNGYTHSNSDIPILENDCKQINSYLIKKVDSKNFNDCIIIFHFYSICKRNQIDIYQEMLLYRDNKTFCLYIEIKKDRYLHEKSSSRDAEQAKFEIIKNLVSKSTSDDINLLFNCLSSCNIIPKNDWDTQYGLTLLFSALESDWEKYNNAIQYYLTKNTPFNINPSPVIHFLLSEIGYKETYNLVNAFEYQAKSLWVITVFDMIPNKEIDDIYILKLNKFMRSQKESDNFYTISFSTVYRINQMYPGFAEGYLSLLIELAEKKPYVISAYIEMEVIQDNGISKFIDAHINHMEVLEKAYLSSMLGRQFFDYEGKLLSMLITNNASFVVQIADVLCDSNNHIGNDLLNSFWENSNYNEVVKLLVETIKNNCPFHFQAYMILEELFSSKSDEYSLSEKQESWLEKYIIDHIDDEDRIKFIFGVIGNLSTETRKRMLSVFCTHNSSFDLFRQLSITPSHWSITGSEVPYIEKRIQYLDEVKDLLLGYKFIEHRAYLSDWIQSLRAKKEKVLLQEFLEER